MRHLRQLYKEVLKDFLSNEIKQYRDLWNLSQERMAELLGIDARSYNYLERKVYACSMTTLILFFSHLEDADILRLIHAIRALLERIDSHDVA